MARSGPPPKPTYLRLLEGNPGRKKISKREPKPRRHRKAPEPPTWLDVHGKRVWRLIAKKLVRFGLLTELDHVPLAAVCDSYATWRRCRQVVLEEGYSVDTKETTKPRPEALLMERARRDFVRFAAEFGMTPAARTRIEVDVFGLIGEKSGKDDSEDFFGS